MQNYNFYVWILCILNIPLRMNAILFINNIHLVNVTSSLHFFYIFMQNNDFPK